MRALSHAVRGLAVAGIVASGLVITSVTAEAQNCVASGVSKRVEDGRSVYTNDSRCGSDPNRRGDRNSSQRPGGSGSSGPSTPAPTTRGGCLSGIVGSIACSQVPEDDITYMYISTK